MIAKIDERDAFDVHNDKSTRLFQEGVCIEEDISKEELYSRGMKMLHDFFGIVNAEIFISLVRNEKYNYTEWRRDYYDTMTAEEYFADVREFAKAHPYKGDPSTILKSSQQKNDSRKG